MSKQQDVIELAVKLLKLEVEDDVFMSVFGEPLLVIGGECFFDDLALIQLGQDHCRWQDKYIIYPAINGACKVLFNTNFSAIFKGKGRKEVIDEVLTKVRL